MATHKTPPATASAKLVKTGRNFKTPSKNGATGKPQAAGQGEAAGKFRPPAPGTPTQRPYALSSGEFTVPDDFDDALPDDVLEAFGVK